MTALKPQSHVLQESLAIELDRIEQEIADLGNLASMSLDDLHKATGLVAKRNRLKHDLKQSDDIVASFERRMATSEAAKERAIALCADRQAQAVKMEQAAYALADSINEMKRLDEAQRIATMEALEVCRDSLVDSERMATVSTFAGSMSAVNALRDVFYQAGISGMFERLFAGHDTFAGRTPIECVKADSVQLVKRLDDAIARSVVRRSPEYIALLNRQAELNALVDDKRNKVSPDDLQAEYDEIHANGIALTHMLETGKLKEAA